MKLPSKLDAWIQIYAGKMFKLGISTICFFQLHLRGMDQSRMSCGVWQPIPMETAAPTSAPTFISIRRLSQPGIRFCTEGVLWAPSRQRMRQSEERRRSFLPRRRPSKQIWRPSRQQRRPSGRKRRIFDHGGALKVNSTPLQ